MIVLNSSWFLYQKTGTEIAYSGKLVGDIFQAINTAPEINFQIHWMFPLFHIVALTFVFGYKCVHEDFPISYDTAKVVPYIQEYHVCGFLHLVSSNALLL